MSIVMAKSPNGSRVIFLLVVMIMFMATASAAMPVSLNYQGYLSNIDSSPVNNPSESITFTLYDSNIGGAILWTETQSVNVVNGVFSVQLGSGANPLPQSAFENPVWIGIKVGIDAEMAPRSALDVSAYAIKAEDANTLTGKSATQLNQDLTDAISAHTSDPSAHHTKTTSFTDMTDQIADAQIPASIARVADISWNNLANIPTGFADGVDDVGITVATADANYVNATGDIMTGGLSIQNGLDVDQQINTMMGYQINNSNVLVMSGANQNSVSVGYNTDSPSGQDNTTVGTHSAANANTGSVNTYLGMDSGLNNASGSENTGVGSNAGYSNTSGSFNTYVGYEAGHDNMTGNNNTYLGAYAGFLSPGSRNVFIGYGAGYNFWGDDNLVIGDSSSGEPLISGNFASKDLVFNGKVQTYYTNDTGSIESYINSSTATTAGGLEIQIGPLTNPSTSNYYITFKEGGGPVIGSITGNGAGGVSFNTTSDARLKTNIVEYKDGLDLVSRMKVKEYEFKTAPGNEQVGFLAQELQTVFPQAVSGDPNGDVKTHPMTVDYSKLTPVLTAAIQELINRNKTQADQLSQLRNENALQKTELEKMHAELKGVIQQVQLIQQAQQSGPLYSAKLGQ